MAADDPSHPLLKVYNDIGKITVGISTLQKGQEQLAVGQEEVEDKISNLHHTVSSLVTKDDCEAHRAEFAEELAGEKDEGNPKRNGLLQKAADNAGNISKILTLVATLAVGLWAAHKFVVRVESALRHTAGQTVNATRELERRLDNPQPPQVVYVPIAVSPDAGPRRRRSWRTRDRRAARPRTNRATSDTR